MAVTVQTKKKIILGMFRFRSYDLRAWSLVLLRARQGARGPEVQTGEWIYNSGSVWPLGHGNSVSGGSF